MNRNFIAENFDINSKANKNVEIDYSSFSKEDYNLLQLAFQKQAIVQGTIVGYDEDQKYFSVEILKFNEKFISDIYTKETIVGLIGVLPLDEIESKRREDVNLEKYVDNYLGRNIMFKIQHIDVENNAVVVSRRVAQEESSQRVFEDLEKGDVVFTTVESYAFDNGNREAYGLFCNVYGTIGMLHKSELAHYYIKDVRREKIQIGDSLELLIDKIDKENKKIDLSLKKLLKNPIDDVIRNYKANQKVVGTVVNIRPNGVLVELKKGVNVFCKVPKYMPNLEDRVTLKLSHVKYEQKRLFGYIIKRL